MLVSEPSSFGRADPSWLAVALLVVSVSATTGCADEPDEAARSAPLITLPATERAAIVAWLAATPTCVGPGKPAFEDRTVAAGLLHRADVPQDTLPYRRWYGGGVALVDLDGDGHLDVFATDADGPNRLFVGRGDGTFTDVTSLSRGAAPDHRTRAVTAADVDGDGRLDLYLAGDGRDLLLRNVRDGDGVRFVDITATAGLTNDRPSGGAAFADLDGDGDLDLWVSAPLVAWDTISPPEAAGRSRLWRNDGGVFTDITATAVPGGAREGSSFVGVLVDLDGDARPDLLDASEFGDPWPSRLLRNDAVMGNPIRLSEAPTPVHDVMPEAAMGAALIDSGGPFPDLMFSNLHGVDGRREVYLRNQGAMTLVDATVATHAATMDEQAPMGRGWRAVSWAVIPADFDNDGNEDVLTVYGALTRDGAPKAAIAMFGPRYSPGQPDALLWGRESGFEAASGSCAEDTGSGRGAAAGDVDGDGCIDLLITNLGGGLRLLRNRCGADAPGPGGRWLVVKLLGAGANTRAGGAVVEVTAGGKTQRRRVTAGATSVHSTQPYAAHFGFGEFAVDAPMTVRVRWPSGGLSAKTMVTPNRVVTLKESAG